MRWPLAQSNPPTVHLILVQPVLGRDGRNRERIASAVDELLREQPTGHLDEHDLLVLPEHWSGETDARIYESEVRELARAYGCHVVGGSQHAVDATGIRNRGVVVGPDGSVLETYEKLRPYGAERHVVTAGSRYGVFTLDGFDVLVLLCADFWFVDLIQRAPKVPDLIVVPALSVSRKATPEFARRLWQHMGVSRAYELACYVGISDWAFESDLPTLKASGVAGFADPSATDPETLFTEVRGTASLFELSRLRLTAFRADRAARGFLWRGSPTPSDAP